MRTAWKSRAKSPGPERGPSTRRMALTKSSLVAKGACARRSNHFGGQSAGPRLVAEFPEDPGEFLGGGLVQQVGGGLAGAGHPHVERGATSKGESQRLVIELPRRNTEVQQDEVGAEGGDGLDGFGGGIRRREEPDPIVTKAGT